MINRNYVTPQILSDIDKINNECVRMHLPPPPVVFVKCDVSQIKSDCIALSHFEKANSWNRNFYNILLAQTALGYAADTTFGEGKLTVKYTSGSVYQISNSGSNFGTPAVGLAAAGDATRGILIGTGDGAESFESYTLGATIAHGTGAGQISYGGAALTASYDAGLKKWTVAQSRIMSNTSGNDIIIKETGLIWGTSVKGSLWPSLIERNLLAAPVTVPNNYKVTVTYTFELTFPA